MVHPEIKKQLAVSSSSHIGHSHGTLPTTGLTAEWVSSRFGHTFDSCFRLRI